MRIKIDQPVGFNELGQRQNNEDSLFPPLGSAHANSRLFLVCDGVGGRHKGEVASALACESISSFFDGHPSGLVDEDYINQALRFTVGNFVKKENQEEESRGMATTVTLLSLHENGITIAHVGDSRVYQIRNGRVIHTTDDHSMVNELVKAGHLTQREASSHSQRNVITRVVSADRNDLPDVYTTTDVLAGDYFFLCSDGVLEQLTQYLLEFHLRETDDNQVSNQEKLENLKQECDGRTRDNFTAYLVRVSEVTGEAPGEPIVVVPPLDPIAISPEARSLQDTVSFRPPAEINLAAAPKMAARQTYQPKKRNPTFRATPYLIAAALGIIASFAWLWFKKNDNPKITIPAQKVKFKPKVEKPVSAPTTLPKKEKPATSQSEKAPAPAAEIYITAPPSDDVVAESKKYSFSIKKGSAGYYAWEPGSNRGGKKTKIIYRQDISIPGLLHYYKFARTKTGYLYLSKPDIRISEIDSIVAVNRNEGTFYAGGSKYRVATDTGQKTEIPLNQ